MDVKWAVSYNVFDGEELLEYSIKQIREQVDLVSVVWQDISNYGLEHPNSEKQKATIDDLLERGLIDLAIKFNVKDVHKDAHATRHHYEAQKREIGRQIAEKHGATYYASLDCDEMYFPHELKRAKRKIVENNFDATACHIYTYHANPEHQSVGIAPFYVPFFHKVKLPYKLGHNHYFCYADPTRGVSGWVSSHIFPIEEVGMHHYTMTREHLAAKYGSHNGAINFIKDHGDNFVIAKVKEVVEFDIDTNNNPPHVIVDNYFGLPNYIERNKKEYELLQLQSSDRKDS